MRHVLLIVLLALLSSFAIANEDQQRASSETIEALRTEIIELKLAGLSVDKQRDPRCDEDNRRPPRRDPVSCVSNCTWRNVDGSCLSYGADFCGVNPSCTPNCTWRNVDGSCLSYGADICR